MLRSIKELDNYTLRAVDGDIGKVIDFYFDDEHWAVRYLAIDTGGWLSGRQVLISPMSFRGANWEEQHFDVALTREQIEGSPDISTHQPISRQREQEYAQYYGYPQYWGGVELWGAAGYAPGLMTGQLAALAAEEQAAAERERAERTGDQPPEEQADAHLRSTDEVIGYYLEATDGEIGHVEDFIVDDDTWAIRYMVVDTRNWLPGRKVLVSPQWIASISWIEGQVRVDLTQETIKNSPEYDSHAPVNRDYEAQLYDYLGRPAYWQR